MKTEFQTNAELNQKMASMVARGWKAIPCSGGYIMIMKHNHITLTSEEKLCTFTNQSQLTELSPPVSGTTTKASA